MTPKLSAIGAHPHLEDRVMRDRRRVRDLKEVLEQAAADLEEAQADLDCSECELAASEEAMGL